MSEAPTRPAVAATILGELLATVALLGLLALMFFFAVAAGDFLGSDRKTLRSTLSLLWFPVTAVLAWRNARFGRQFRVRPRWHYLGLYGAQSALILLTCPYFW